MQWSFVDNIDCMSKYKLVEWKAAFGHRPIVCLEAWIMIRKEAGNKKLSVNHYFWALYWMRTYETETNAARQVGSNPKTLREKVKLVVGLLSQKMHKRVGLLPSNFYI